MPDEAAAPALPASRSLRVCYAVIQLVSLFVLMGLCWIGKGFEKIYAELGMTDLPALTALAIGIGNFVRTPIGAAVTVTPVLVLVILGRTGRLDRYLRDLIVGNVLGTVFMTAGYIFYIYAPIVRIQEALKDR